MSKYKKAFSNICVGIKKIMPDLLAVSGSVCLSYGAYLFIQPLGYLVMGVLLICGAYIWSKAD